MKNQVKILILFVSTVLIGFAAVTLIKYRNHQESGPVIIIDTESNDEPFIPEHENAQIQLPENESVLNDKKEAPVLDLSSVRVSLTVAKDSYYYTVRGIKCSHADDDDIVYVLSDNFGHQYQSNNGTFSKVSPNAEGKYDIVAKYTNINLASESKKISGFAVKKPISDKLTAEKLTSLIQTGDYDGCKSEVVGKISKTVKVECSNPEYGCSTIPEVFMSVGLENWNVRVERLDYNYLNEVIGITISAQKS